MNCQNSYKLKDTDYLFWVGNYQNRQAEADLLAWAESELPKIFLEPNILQAFLDGKYGASHGALTFLALYNADDPEEEAQRQLEYWYTRESKARGDKDISNWNPDSKMDFLVPLLVTKYFMENQDVIKTDWI